MKKRVIKSKRSLFSKKRVIAIVCAGIAIMMLVFGGILLKSDKIIDHNIQSSNQDISVKRMKNDNALQNKKAATYDFKAISPINLKDSVWAASSRDKFYHTGIIKIPSIGVRSIINKGMNPVGLYSAVGEAKPGQIMGKQNFAIGGHNNFGYEKNNYLFSSLKDIKKDALIYLTDGTTKYTYRTTNIKVVRYTKGTVIQNSEVKDKPIVTLFTCWSPNHENNPKYRLIVRGELVSKRSSNSEF